MTDTDLAVAAGLGGLATYLVRFLPMALSQRWQVAAMPKRWRRFMLALGPSAIAALAVLSLADLHPAQDWPHALTLSAAVVAVVMTQHLSQNPAWATIAGTLVYGLSAVVTPL